MWVTFYYREIRRQKPSNCPQSRYWSGDIKTRTTRDIRRYLCLDLRVDWRSDVQMVLRKEAVSRQSISVSARKASWVMLQLGVFLGVVYLLFLALWIWATRLRSRD
jgi:hypothetical protein